MRRIQPHEYRPQHHAPVFPRPIPHSRRRRGQEHDERREWRVVDVEPPFLIRRPQPVFVMAELCTDYEIAVRLKIVEGTVVSAKAPFPTWRRLHCIMRDEVPDLTYRESWSALVCAAIQQAEDDMQAQWPLPSRSSVFRPPSVDPQRVRPVEDMTP